MVFVLQAEAVLATVLMNYHIGRPVLSSLCVGALGAGGFWWCSFCRLQTTCFDRQAIIVRSKNKRITEKLKGTVHLHVMSVLTFCGLLANSMSS